MAEMNPRARRAVVVLAVVLILAAIAGAGWMLARKGSNDASKAKAKPSVVASPSPSSSAAEDGDVQGTAGAVLATTAPEPACEACANAYGQVSMTPSNSLSSLPRALMYGPGGWAATDTFTMHWHMASNANDRVWWENDPRQDVQIEWQTAYLVSFKGAVTTVDLRGKPAEVVFKMGTVRDVAIYGVFVAPQATTGSAPNKDKPILP